MGNVMGIQAAPLASEDVGLITSLPSECVVEGIQVYATLIFSGLRVHKGPEFWSDI